MGFTFMFILKDGWMDGWMDGEGMKLWLEKVWSKRPGGLLKKPSVLVCDKFKARVTESTKMLATKLKMHLAVIPGGLTSHYSLWTFQLINHSRDLCMRNGQSGLRHQLIMLHRQEE